MRLVADYSRSFVELLDPLHFDDSELAPFVIGLERLWISAAIAALERDTPQSWYANALNERASQLSQRLQNFEATRTEIARLTSTVGDLESELRSAKLTAKPSIKWKINQTRADRDEKLSLLEELFVGAVESLLPEGATLEDAEDACHAHWVAPGISDRITARALRAMDAFLDVRPRAPATCSADRVFPLSLIARASDIKFYRTATLHRIREIRACSSISEPRTESHALRPRRSSSILVRSNSRANVASSGRTV
ncbi:hypothetical protein BO443_220021 [Burkholderia orbicola]